MSNSVIPTQCQNKKAGIITSNASICHKLQTNCLDTCTEAVLLIKKPIKTSTVTVTERVSAPPTPEVGCSTIWVDSSGNLQVKRGPVS